MSPTPAVSLILHFAQCTGIQDTLRFWIPCCGFQIPGTKFQILCQWILAFNHYGIPDFLRSILDYKNPRFRIPEFQIPKQKLPGFWYSDSLMWGETLRNEGTLGIHPLYSSIYNYYIYFSNTFLFSFKHHINTSLTDQSIH